jgi:hypothetical protein
MALTKVTYSMIKNAPIDVQDIGLVPDDVSAAATNAQLLQDFLDPRTVDGYTGLIFFGGTNVTYHFSSQQIRIRNGISIDLNQNTLSFVFTASSSQDINKGFFTVEHDFELFNGTIICDITNNPSYVNAGTCVQLGLRDVDDYFGDTADSLLPYRKGQFYLHDLKLVSNAIAADAIASLGGVENCVLENIIIEGQGTLRAGIRYEWGWADRVSPVYDRQTSHARNWRINNIVVKNCATEAITLRGAYNFEVSNTSIFDCDVGIDVGSGEASFYNPWNPDRQGTRNNMRFVNIVMQDIETTGMVLVGCNYGTLYLNPVITNADRIRLLDCTLENVKIGSKNVATASWGISSTLRNLQCKNVFVSNFDRGFFITGDWWKVFMDFVQVRGNAREGIFMSKSGALFSNPNIVEIRNSLIFENGDGATTAGINYEVNVGSNVLIENNTFGVVGESDQYYSIAGSVLSEDVMIRYNNTQGTAGGVAYFRGGATTTRGNILENNVGVITSEQQWERLGQFGFSSAGTQTLSVAREQTSVFRIGASSVTYTLPTNANAPISIGAQWQFIGGYASGTSSIAKQSGVTLNVYTGSAYTANVTSITMAAGSFANVQKMGVDEWNVWGTGLTAVP